MFFAQNWHAAIVRGRVGMPGMLIDSFHNELAVEHGQHRLLSLPLFHVVDIQAATARFDPLALLLAIHIVALPLHHAIDAAFAGAVQAVFHKMVVTGETVHVRCAPFIHARTHFPAARALASLHHARGGFVAAFIRPRPLGLVIDKGAKRADGVRLLEVPYAGALALRIQATGKHAAHAAMHVVFDERSILAGGKALRLRFPGDPLDVVTGCAAPLPALAQQIRDGQKMAFLFLEGFFIGKRRRVVRFVWQ